MFETFLDERKDLIIYRKGCMMKHIEYQVLNQAQCEKIIEAVFRLLETTGCMIQSESARLMLAENGCKIQEKRVQIPKSLMKWAIKQAPSTVNLYSRDGEKVMCVGSGKSYFGPAISTVYVRDVESGEKRSAVFSDAVNAAIVCDALPNVSWASAMSGLSDGVHGLDDVYEVLALLPNTKKPLMYWAASLQNLKYEFEMFDAVAGDEGAYGEKPFSIALVCPMDPLSHLDEALEQLMFLAKRRAPVVYIAGVSLGGNSPITPAGNIIVGIADTLVGLLISQLTQAGAPFVVSKFSDNLDMSTVTIGRSHPELIAANAATADVFHYLGLPFCLNLGDTDSGSLDQMAAFDIGMQLYTASLSGTDMAMSIGGFESCNMSSLNGLVFANDAIDFIDVITGGVALDDESMALDVIDHVGPGGNYLMETHTFQRCRSGWRSDIMRARTLKDIAEGNVADWDAASREKVKTILAKGVQHPLDSAVEQRLNKIMKKAEKKASSDL